MTTQDKKTSRRRVKGAVLGDNVKVAGMNASALKDAKENASLLTSGNSTIELKISDDQLAVFELITVQSSEIEDKTFVPDQNGRDPKFVTQESVEDLSATMVKRGQIVPGIGYLNENGKIAVLSGSRRRFSCLSVGIPFKIYVTKLIVEDEDAKYLADITNLSKPLSLIEQGRKYTHQIETKVYKNARAIAEAEGITPSMVSMAISASKIPEFLIDLFPHLTQLGRPTITTLRSLAKERPSKELVKASTIVQKHTFEDLCQLAGSRNPYKLNSQVLELLLKELNSQKTTVEASTFSYSAKGGGNYKIITKDNETSYQFCNLSTDKLDEVENAIKEILGANN
ncbi:ParB/RepB/Spo0J family partition protein (plasmid) [Psychrobium sp. nBUS_13]|uniref:ParB/RepB/Spo0J family partition protein n=1 Tax=Psychrobium sp. nBUS_13 TaxID=3395319 RepID=UPI003EBC2461